MGAVVVGWLVLELTNSPTLVGVVAACRYIGMGLGPLIGFIGDRYNRRRILIISRLGIAFCSLILAILYYTGLLEVWCIVALVLLQGILLAVDWTTRYAVVPDVVGSDNVTNAMGLLLAGWGITAVVGSLAGGHLLEHIGAGGCFAIIAGFLIFASLLVLPMHVGVPAKKVSQKSRWENLIAGIRYVLNDKVMCALIVLLAIINLLAFPCIYGIGPVFARDVLNLQASGFGWLVAAEGLGGFIGSIIISTTGGVRRKGRILSGAIIVWSVLLVIFSFSRLLYFSITLLICVGIVRGLSVGTFEILFLSWAKEEIRARVIGVRMFPIVTLVGGNILSGVMASYWGPENAIMVNGLVCLLLTILTVLWIPQLLRRGDESHR